jgi:phosphoribosylformimino-5-aminoimidazole carboxamide ribotide isomerase
LLIIPAIDIKGGMCVRLVQGRMEDATVYSDDPAGVARRWESMGAGLIHVVDLDGAVEGGARNLGVVREIAGAINAEVQVGGGIRDEKTAEAYLGMEGVKRIILGTAACKDAGLLKRLASRFPGRVAAGIDAKDGRVAVRGWVEVTDESAAGLAKRLEDSGVSCIIYTDISRDGMLSGPNVEATRVLAAAVSIPVVASGGVASMEDIASYRGVALEGIIVGKALYTGGIALKEAIEAARAL